MGGDLLFSAGWDVCIRLDAVILHSQPLSDLVHLACGHMVHHGSVGDTLTMRPIHQHYGFLFCQTSVCLHSPKQTRVPQKIQHRRLRFLFSLRAEVERHHHRNDDHHVIRCNAAV